MSPEAGQAVVPDAVAAVVPDAVAAVVADAQDALSRTTDPLDASVIRSADAATLVRRHGLRTVRDLALLLLPLAARLADPPISGYRVPAVGIEGGSGDLILGGNLEVPGADLGSTVHAEGFVSLRARRRARVLAVLALTRASPCAHCRQTLVESAGAEALRIIDPDGRDVGLTDLVPQAFGPAALGVAPDDPSVAHWPALAFDPSFAGDAPPARVGDALLAAGRAAHAPYSGAPSAVVLRCDDGTLLAAGCVESVAFNPTITALQAALVERAAAGIDRARVREAWLGRVPGGMVDPSAGFDALLSAALPGARGHVVDWHP